MSEEPANPVPSRIGLRTISNNIASLSFIQLANYLFPIVVVPYLVRTLGLDGFGIYAVAQSITQYIILITEYGYNITSTRAIAQNGDNVSATRRIFCSTMLAKFVLFCGAVPIAIAVVYAVPALHATFVLVCVGLIAVIGSVLTPLWYFQGKERLGFVAVATLVPRLGALALFPVLVNDAQDLHFAMLLYSAPTLVAGLTCQVALLCSARSPYCRVAVADVACSLREGWHIFLSRVCVGFYYSLNPLVISLLWEPIVVGSYSAAEKIVFGVSGLSAPVAQAIYPRVSAQVIKSPARARTLMIWSLAGHAAMGVALSAALYLAGPIVIKLLYGAPHPSVASVLAVLSPVPFLLSLGAATGLQVLLAAGHDREFSRSLLLGAGFNILAIVPLTAAFGATGAAASAVGSQFAVVALQAYYARKVLSGSDIMAAKPKKTS